MAVSKTTIAEIRYAASEFLGAAAEVTVVENHNPRLAECSNRGEIVSKISRQAWEAVASPDAEMVAAIVGARKETGSVARVGPSVPGGVPRIVSAIRPGIAIRRMPLGVNKNCRCCEIQRQKCAPKPFHKSSRRPRRARSLVVYFIRWPGPALRRPP
jgi:hypothetical protein